MTAIVGVIMGSKSDWKTMTHTTDLLDILGIAYESKIVSAHRTPDVMNEYALSAEKRGLKVIIAGAGGAAHLPGMIAAQTQLPVIGVPVESKALNGLDSLLSNSYSLHASSVTTSKKKIQKTSILVVCFLLMFGIILISKQKE